MRDARGQHVGGAPPVPGLKEPAALGLRRARQLEAAVAQAQARPSPPASSAALPASVHRRRRRAGALSRPAPSRDRSNASCRTPAALRCGRSPRRRAGRRRAGRVVDEDQLVLAAQLGKALAGLVAVRRKLGERVALAQLPPHPGELAAHGGLRRAPRAAGGTATTGGPSRGMLMPIVRRRALRRSANVTSSTVEGLRSSGGGIIAGA